MKFSKIISSSLAIGLLFNSAIPSLASILSEDGRYETFEGNNITIDDILEEDKVDVEIEGNTMVNVANQKDPVPITKTYTVEGTNHIPLQGEYDGKARPVIEGNTMYYNNDTGELTDTFTEGANLSLVSSFEDQLVTQEMVDSGLEKAENLGKYKVEYKITGKNKLNPEWLPEILKSDSVTNGISISVNEGKITQSGIATASLTTFGKNIIDYLEDNTEYIKYSIPGLGLEITTINDENIYPNENSFTVNKTNMKRIRFYYQLTQGASYSSENEIPQLEEGSTVTKNESYKESIKTFYLNSPLLEGDTIENIDGKATHVRKYRKVVLNGSESGWNPEVTSLANTVFTQYYLSGLNSVIMNDKLPVNYIWDKDVEGVYYNNDYNALHLRLNKSRLSTFDIDGIKKWLSENPITIVYKLDTPIYETISEKSILIDSYVDGHLDLNTDISVNKVDFIPDITNLNYLYPSTEYTVQFESDNKGKIDRVLLSDKVLYTDYSVVKGVNRFNITTPSDTTSNKLVLDGIGFNLSNLVVTQATTESFDYFEGMKSVGQDDVNGHKIEIVSSPNKIPKTKTVYKDYGIEINFASYAIKENLYAHNLSDKIISVHTVKDGVHSRMFPIDPNSTTFINLNDGESIYCFAGLYGDGWNNDNTELLKKSIVLTIDENSFNKIEIPLTEPLRSVPNGVKDKIIRKNGQWVVERNCGEVMLDGEGRINNSATPNQNNTIAFSIPLDKLPDTGLEDAKSISDKFKTIDNYSDYNLDNTEYICTSARRVYFRIFRSKLPTQDIQGFAQWLKENPITLVYQLETPIYEPLNIDSTINTYLDVTHISNNSNIPANMKVTMDRAINRAVDAIELTKTNPTIDNISQSRYWTNLLKETINKDGLQDEINSITNIEDLQLEKKSVTANVDIYIKSDNALSMTLSTNSIMFDEYSGVSDIEKLNALEITVNSSLPYDLNAYLENEIQNSDKSTTIDNNLLQIKESKDLNYKTFINTTDKVILEEDCPSGNYNKHNIDLKIEGSNAYKADVYKTVIKFEAQQK